jgi:spore germination protein
MGIYTVRASDSLASISQKFRVPTEVIKRMNGLLSTAVVPGLALYIPDNDLPTQFYQVRRGDTLAGIARHFHTSSKRIQQANPSVRFHAGVRLRIPTPIRYQMETVGFVIPSEINNLRPLFQQIASQLTYLAIFSYSVNPDGTLNGVDDRLAITASRSRGVRPLMVLTNWVGDRFDPVLIGRISANPTLRSTLIRHVIDTLNTKGYGGVSVDFEFVPPESRNNFTALIRELKGAMGPGLILHLNAHPKTSDLPSNRIVGAFDYAVLGAILDRIAIMAIEHGYPSGPPNPIAPIWWVEQVIRYATSQIDRSK